MNKTYFRFILLFFFSIAIACNSGCKTNSKQNKSEKPNVVFIIVDDLNDYEGVFGGHPQVKTPNIDKLAKSGVAFVNAHSNCPVCAPSRNSLFTGVYPHDSKDFGWTALKDQPVLKNNKTIMELFAENGYHVMGSGKLLHHHRKDMWHEWGAKVNNYGPVAFNGTEPVGHPSVPEPFRSIGPIDGSFAPLSDVPVFPDSISKGKKTGWLYSMWGGKAKKEGEFLEYKDENNRDLMPDEMHAQWAAIRIGELENQDTLSSFFMGIGFMRPHTPLYAPKRFFDMFPIEELELPEILKGDEEDTHYKNIYPSDIKGLRYYRTIKESYGGNAEEGLKHFLQAYLACIAFVDEQIGVVVDAVNSSKFADNTIIVLVADHGWQMGEKEYLFKNSPWEESTRIPYIIRAPGTQAGKQIDHPVSLIDLFPTFIDLCGLQGNNRKNDEGGKLGGFSLKPFIENPKTNNWKGPNGALTMVGVGLNKEEVEKQTYSYRTKDWRYIKYMDGKEELYHSKKDPFEWENLANKPAYTNTKQELKTQMINLINKDQL